MLDSAPRTHSGCKQLFIKLSLAANMRRVSIFFAFLFALNCWAMRQRRRCFDEIAGRLTNMFDFARKRNDRIFLDLIIGEVASSKHDAEKAE